MFFSSCLRTLDEEYPPLRILILGNEDSGKTTLIRRIVAQETDSIESLKSRAQETLQDNWHVLMRGGCNIPEDCMDCSSNYERLRDVIADPRFREFAWSTGLGTPLDNIDFWKNRTGLLTSQSNELSVEEKLRSKFKSNLIQEYSVENGGSQSILLDVPAKYRLDQDFLSQQQELGGVCYVIGLDSFDQVDPITHRSKLETEIEAFQQVFLSLPTQALKGIPIIIFLNKWDVFQTKLRNNVPFSTSERFKDFRKKHDDLEKDIIHHLKKKFRSAIPKSLRRQCYKTIFMFVSSSTDTDQSSKVFSSLKCALLCKALSNAGFL